MFVAQLAIILVAAKLGGEVAERFLRIPAVIGELSVGILIGPFALGGIDLPYVGPLFYYAGGDADHQLAVPITQVLHSTAEVGAIVLLFMAGLETDLRQFLRYSGPASLVALAAWLCHSPWARARRWPWVTPTALATSRRCSWAPSARLRRSASRCAC